jgi:protein-tyrosine-phosphatase
MTIEVERVGDYAATMCRAIAQLDRAVDGKVLDEIKSIGLSSIQMFREAIDAFQESDASKAKSLKSKSDLIERSLITAFDEIIDEGNSGKRQLEELFDLFIIVNRFDRVSDQSKNLCEEIIFWLTGETKPLKRYRIQFTDSVGDGRLNIALAVAHKMYPESASYAGKTGESIDAFTAEQLDRNGLNPANATRTDWDPDVADPAHVIVSLSGNVLNDIDKVPFHSIAQDWDLPGRISSDLPETEKADAFKALIQNISVRLQSLVEALRGEENAN